jgi:outer membrane murein-binding lipoprotein Lpp
MSENKDVYAQSKSQMRLSERIAAALPGFRGYKEKELRRESDKLIRNNLTLKLTKDKDSVRSISQKIADKRYMDVLTDVDRLNAKMDRITEKVNHASYGYAGFYDAVKIKEDNLDKMITFDNQLLDEVNALTAAIEDLKTQLLSNNFANLKDKIQAITDKFELLEDTFDKREEVIQGVTQ